jgi:hypothetical protein
LSRRAVLPFVAALGLLGALPARADDAPKKRHVVAAIGDSLTDPKSHGGKYLDTLRARCPESRFDAWGKGGEMVNQMRKRFARDILGDPPDPSKPAYTDVIVFGGVNDLYSDETAGRTVEKIEKDLGAMYAMAKKRGMRVVAINVAPWGGFKKFFTAHRGDTTRQLNAWIAMQVDAGTIDAAIDAHAILRCGDPDKLCDEIAWKDGIHFNAKGHEKLGEALSSVAFSNCK